MLIQKYNPKWIGDFNRIKTVIAEILEGLDIQIEHVGSTSISQLAAKPIIDIDIIYDNNVSFDAIKIRLEKLDYYHNGNQGIEDREVFKRDKSKKTHSILDFITHHLYVCPIGSNQLERHLLFRDYLRENALERKEYEQLKYQIAEKANQDRKVYAKLKEKMAKTFIEEVLAKAKTKSITY